MLNNLSSFFSDPVRENGEHGKFRKNNLLRIISNETYTRKLSRSRFDIKYPERLFLKAV
jgi:hypothetical protein